MSLEFLLGGSAVAILLVQVLKQLTDGLSKRFGSVITQLVLLVVAIIVAAVGKFFNMLPDDITSAVLQIVTGAIAGYEILIKAVYQQAIRGEK